MKNNTTKKLTTVSMLCAMAVVINLLIHFPIVPSVSFLNYDPKDIIIVIGGFIYGPFISFVMSAICAVFDIMFRGGTIIDILMNMIATCTFCCTAAYLYKRNHTKKGAIIGLLCGILFMTISMTLWNYAITPIYFGMPREAVVGLLLPGIVPFNIFKSSMNALAALLIYKPVVNALRSSHLVEDSHETMVKKEDMFVIAGFIVVTVIVIILGYQGII